MRLTLLLLMGGILLLSACGEEDSDPTFSFKRTLAPEGKSLGDSDSVLAFEADLAIRYELVAGDGRACAYGQLSANTGGNFLNCWGRRINPKYKTLAGHRIGGTNKMLSIGEDHICTTGLLTSQRVQCDGSNSHGQNTDPTPINLADSKSGHWLTDPYVVASGARHNCSLDAFGVYCWGGNSQGQTDVPVLSLPKWVSAGGDTSCAIDDNNGIDELVCWGSNEHGQTDIPDSLTAISKVAVGDGYVCVSNVGQVECWGDTADWDVPATSYTNVVHISAGKDHVCILDETQAVPQVLSAQCFGNNNSAGDLLTVPEPPLSVLNTKIRTISAGNGLSCASYDYDGYAYSPEKDGSYTEEVHKGILCWGKNDEDQINGPKQLCLGYHSKAIDYDDRTCPEN